MLANYRNPLLLLKWEQLYSLDRQTIRAHRMEIEWTAAGLYSRKYDPMYKKYKNISLVAFAILFGGNSKKRLSSEEWFAFITLSPGGIFFITWLSLIYEVLVKLKIELKRFGITELGFINNYDPELETKLYGIRNSVFHVSGEYWDQNRLHEVLEPGIAKSVWHLHKELMDTISNALKKIYRDPKTHRKFLELLNSLDK